MPSEENKESEESKAYPTAQVSPDPIGLGRTSGQRGAEIFAGIRAEIFPSPVTFALSRLSGRLTARVMKSIAPIVRGSITGYVNFMIARTDGITRLVQAAVPTDSKDILIVDIAAGYSPRGMQLAAAFPTATVIEIDLPDVVEEKQRRLRTAKDVVIPENLSWLAADLGVQALSDVLQNRAADVISAEGLTPYFAPPDLIRIATQVKDNLKPGGTFVTDMAWSEGIARVRRSAGYLSRQAGTFLGAMKDSEQAEGIFRDAGYDTVHVYTPTQVSTRFDLPLPVEDLEFLVVAHKTAAKATENDDTDTVPTAAASEKQAVTSIEPEVTESTDDSESPVTPEADEE